MRNGLSESFIGHSPAFFRHRKQDTGERLTFILGWRKFIFSTKAREFLLTVICARAQQEGRSKSGDIKWGAEKSIGDPRVQVLSKNLLWVHS